MPTQDVPTGFLLDPSGGSLKIHRLLPECLTFGTRCVPRVCTKSPVLTTPAAKTTRGDSGIPDNQAIYCSAMPCVNAELDTLHREAPGELQWRCIDRYLTICGLLKSALDSRNSVPEGAEVRRMTIQCLCGDPAHSVSLSKIRHAPCFPFDHNFPYKPEVACIRANNRYINTRNVRQGALLHVSAFIPPLHSTLHYGTLPDLCMYIQRTLQRQYHDAACLKHNRKMQQYLHGTNHRKGNLPTQPTPTHEIATGLLCSIIQVSVHFGKI